MKMNKRFLILAVICFLASHFFAFILGWGMGKDYGFEVGYQFAYSQVKNTFKAQIKEGRNFHLKDMNFKFYPRKDGNIIIAGGGSQGPRRTWE